MTHQLFKVLEKDHDEQRELCKQLIEAKENQARKELREKLYAELYPHIMGEEESIFALLKKSNDEDVRDDALEALQEHHVDKILLNELMALPLDHEMFKAKAKVLCEVNNHHLEEEEDEIFDHLKDLSDDQLDEQLTLFRDAKKNYA